MTIRLVPGALLDDGASWRVFELLFCPLPPGAGSSTSAMNTCDGVLTAFLHARVVRLFHAGVHSRGRE